MITTFYPEGPTATIAMCDLKIGIFEHMRITYSLDVDVRFKSIGIILKGDALNIFRSMIVS